MRNRKVLHLLGVSFRTAPVAVREALTFNRAEAEMFLRSAAREIPGLEALVLSTCNRTEFYVAIPEVEPPADDHAPGPGRFLEILKQFRPAAPILRGDCHLYSLSETAAARHLFRVACGLDSSVLGDSQILGQVREAIGGASIAGTLGPVLQELFAIAVRSGRRSRSGTTIGHGSASVGSAIAGMLGGSSAPGPFRPEETRILIMGAGEMARDIGRQLAKRGYRSLGVINRTPRNAEVVASHIGAVVHPWSALGTALADHEVTIAATSCLGPVLTRGLCELRPRSRSRLRLVVDVGVPRNTEPGLGVPVLGIDDIKEEQESALAVRRQAVPEVEAIVAAASGEWLEWQSARPMESILKTLFERTERASREAADQLLGRADASREEVERCLRSTFRRMLREHARELRSLPLPQGLQNPIMP